MILQNDPGVNLLTNAIGSSDGSALCIFALGEHLLCNFHPKPWRIRRYLRRWRRKGHITRQYSVSSFGDVHEDLGMDLIYKGYFNRYAKMEEGDYAYAYFSSITNRIRRVVVMNRNREIIYDPMGSSVLVRSDRLIGLRIFSHPGEVPGKE